MSHYNITYDTNNIAESDKKALDDIRNYLGKKKANDIFKAVEKDTTLQSAQQIRNLFAFIAGIQGYPVEAMLRTYRPDLLEKEEKES